LRKRREKKKQQVEKAPLEENKKNEIREGPEGPAAKAPGAEEVVQLKNVVDKRKGDQP